MLTNGAAWATPGGTGEVGPVELCASEEDFADSLLCDTKAVPISMTTGCCVWPPGGPTVGGDATLEDGDLKSFRSWTLAAAAAAVEAAGLN